LQFVWRYIDIVERGVTFLAQPVALPVCYQLTSWLCYFHCIHCSN